MNHQNVRGVSNLCLSNQEVRREDQENTVLAVSLSEIQSDTANGEKVRRDFLRKVAPVVPSSLHPMVAHSKMVELKFYLHLSHILRSRGHPQEYSAGPFLG